MKRYTERHLPADDARHGTDNGYSNYGCRCTPCVAAHADYRAAATKRAAERKQSGALDSATRDARAVAVGTITLEEYNLRMRNATRPLTDSGIITRHQGPIRSLLAGHRA